MEKDTVKELEILIDEEEKLRYEWKNAVIALQSLVGKATKHNRECCQFWSKHISEEDRVVVNIDDKTLILNVPKLEDASMEAYLPYGIDFNKITSIDIKPKE